MAYVRVSSFGAAGPSSGGFFPTLLMASSGTPTPAVVSRPPAPVGYDPVLSASRSGYGPGLTLPAPTAVAPSVMAPVSDQPLPTPIPLPINSPFRWPTQQSMPWKAPAVTDVQAPVAPPQPFTTPTATPALAPTSGLSWGTLAAGAGAGFLLGGPIGAALGAGAGLVLGRKKPGPVTTLNGFGAPYDVPEAPAWYPTDWLAPQEPFSVVPASPPAPAEPLVSQVVNALVNQTARPSTSPNYVSTAVNPAPSSNTPLYLGLAAVAALMIWKR